MEYKILDMGLPNPAGHSPLRRPGSVRRTTTLDVSWPDGRAGAMWFVGRGRDILTPRDGGDPVVLREETMEARLGWDRTIQSISTPKAVNLAPLVGERGGGRLRQVLLDHLPEERRNGTPLYLLLDDISGVSLISGWSWSRWPELMADSLEGHPMANMSREERFQSMASVCIGFRPGSSALSADRMGPPDQNNAEVVPLPHPDDPKGWHQFSEFPSVHMRRARRIDVWLDDGIAIDAAFQDSGSSPSGRRVAIHEYKLSAHSDAAGDTLAQLKAEPRVLPFAECPNAIENIGAVIGSPLRELRDRVLQNLGKTMGCTHLNDAMRALAETPILAGELRERMAA